MTDLNLTIETQSDGPVEFNTSSNATAREMAEKIRVRKNYPLVDPQTNEPIHYYLINADGRHLDNDAQLGDLGIHTGDRIGFRSSVLPPETMQSSSTLAPPGKLCLAIKMIGRSKPAQEQFDSRTKVDELLMQMIDTYVLPAHFDDNEPIVYAAYSRTLGRNLENTETLDYAGVPNWDTLEILTKRGADSSETKVSLRFCGLSLDELPEVKLDAIISNEPALLAIFHTYKEKISELTNELQKLTREKRTLDYLSKKLNDANISAKLSTVLLILGQILVSFGTNLVTNKSSGGWLLFTAGVAVDLAGLYFAFFYLKGSSIDE